MNKLKNTPQNKLIISGVSVIVFAAMFALAAKLILKADSKLIISISGLGAGVGLLFSFLIMHVFVDVKYNETA